ncbi:melanophilin [Talpa occidentalis]|uniref:melanophilin n=1 Tax=Talpa occidentalis TaxID=50954 RepID=UPI0023F77992|nr:melanophilin [Talpa occidentalis]
MGRKLDLSKLTDEEARHVWEVVQRDIDLRRKEEERLAGLKGRIERDSAQRELLSDAAQLRETHCARCLQPLRLLGGPRRQCLDCHLFACQDCSRARPEPEGWLCGPCHAARVVKMGSLEWYYGHVRARFKSFGSAKVIRSLCGRLQGGGSPDGAHGGPGDQGGPEPSPGERSGDGEQTEEDGDPAAAAHAQSLGSRVCPAALPPPGAPRVLTSSYSGSLRQQGPEGRRGPRGREAPLEGSLGLPQNRGSARPIRPSPAQQRRRLSIHGSDFQADSDDGSGACGRPPSLCTGSGATAGLQAPTGVPCTEVAPTQGIEVPQGPAAGASGAHPDPEEQTDGSFPARPDALAQLPLPAESCVTALGVATPPGPAVAAGERLPSRCPAEVDSSDEESSRARRLPPRPSKQGGPAPESQHPVGSEPTDADIEEVTLRRKLEELTSHVSDQGPTSEEEEGQEEEARPDRSTPAEDPPEGSAAAGQPCGQGKTPQSPQDPVQPGRTTDEQLCELEGRVAMTASEVQQVESEVSDIESRIAALRAAGLTVRPSSRPRRKSNLPIFLPRLVGKLGQSPKDPSADVTHEAQVPPAPYLLKRTFSSAPKSPGTSGDAFPRQSLYRGSLTQRSPSGKRGTSSQSFAVMLLPCLHGFHLCGLSVCGHVGAASQESCNKTTREVIPAKVGTAADLWAHRPRSCPRRLSAQWSPAGSKALNPTVLHTCLPCSWPRLPSSWPRLPKTCDDPPALKGGSLGQDSVTEQPSLPTTTLHSPPCTAPRMNKKHHPPITESHAQRQAPAALSLLCPPPRPRLPEGTVCSSGASTPPASDTDGPSPDTMAPGR